MNRLFYSSSQVHVLSSEARILAEENADDPNLLVVTPNRNAARSLGVREYSLQHLAQEILGIQKIQIAPPLVAQQLLREAIRQIVCPHDMATVYTQVESELVSIREEWTQTVAARVLR